MGLRFNRRVSIGKGVTLNFGKKGVSVSAGQRGAKVTAGTNGSRATVGLTGTGLSWTEQRHKKQTSNNKTDNVINLDDVRDNKEPNITYDDIDLTPVKQPIPSGVEDIKVDKKIWWMLGTTIVLLLLSVVNILFAPIALVVGIISVAYVLTNKTFKNNSYTHKAITYYSYGFNNKCRKYCNKALEIDPSNASAIILLKAMDDIEEIDY